VCNNIRHHGGEADNWSDWCGVGSVAFSRGFMLGDPAGRPAHVAAQRAPPHRREAGAVAPDHGGCCDRRLRSLSARPCGGPFLFSEHYLSKGSAHVSQPNQR